jgi:hypothetical protein
VSGSEEGRRGARIRGDRILFSSSIRRGVRDAQHGSIARAQAKLVEARYYAKRDGLLQDDTAELSSRQVCLCVSVCVCVSVCLVCLSVCVCVSVCARTP